MYQDILQEIHDHLNAIERQGKVASYIPELAKIDPNKFGFHMRTVDGAKYAVGDSDEKFSIQSITKVLALTLAVSVENPAKIWQRVDVEPSGNPFNSLIQLEYEFGIPRNPFINSGALVIADILVEKLENPKEEYLNFIRKLAGSEDIYYNDTIAESEKNYGYRNTALINFMKSFGNIKNDVDKVLDFYYYSCAIEMTCCEVADTFSLFCNYGKLDNGERIISLSQSKRINALMQTCGFYDEAGEFTFRVGLPGKSGVGGGIVAIMPNVFSVAAWSPVLNSKGNSYLGMRALEMLTTKTGLSIF